MNYRKSKNTNYINLYQDYYKQINGGIDGYYEKTILDGDLFEVFESDVIAYFTIHEDRGLTSILVLNKYQIIYQIIFDFIIDLPLFENMLFTENDKSFLKNIERLGIKYEVQSYNFADKEEIFSSLKMKRVGSCDEERIKQVFGNFIEYNRINLKETESYYFEENNQIISFGGFESMILNNKRYSIFMIVNEQFYEKGFGTETVKFLVELIQSRNYECNARCYVNNIASKKTLLRSGLTLSNKLFKANKFNK